MLIVLAEIRLFIIIVKPPIPAICPGMRGGMRQQG